MKVRDFFLTLNLLINDNKTELLMLGSKFQLNKVDNIQTKVGNCTIYPKTKVRNLGFIFDEILNLNEQVNENWNKIILLITEIQSI